MSLKDILMCPLYGPWDQQHFVRVAWCMWLHVPMLGLLQVVLTIRGIFKLPMYYLGSHIYPFQGPYF